MSELTAYQGYSILGLAVELREHLDPDIFDRLYHGGLKYVTRAEARDIEDQLVALRRKVLGREQVAQHEPPAPTQGGGHSERARGTSEA